MPTFISTLQLCFILDVAKVWFESQEGNFLHFVFNYWTQNNAKAAFPKFVVLCFASFTSQNRSHGSKKLCLPMIMLRILTPSNHYTSIADFDNLLFLFLFLDRISFSLIQWNRYSLQTFQWVPLIAHMGYKLWDYSWCITFNFYHSMWF